jgi:hypothetical protein
VRRSEGGFGVRGFPDFQFATEERYPPHCIAELGKGDNAKEGRGIIYFEMVLYDV